jgi:hypothetical protein
LEVRELVPWSIVQLRPSPCAVLGIATDASIFSIADGEPQKLAASQISIPTMEALFGQWSN